MNLEIDILRVLYRLARRRAPATFEELMMRVRADENAMRRALAALARAELVTRTAAGPRLSLAGLALAVACAGQPRSANVARTQARRGERVPLVRRRRTARAA